MTRFTLNVFIFFTFFLQTLAQDEWHVSRNKQAAYATLAIITLLSVLAFFLWKTGVLESILHHQAPTRPNNSQSTIGDFLTSFGSGIRGGTPQYTQLNQQEI